MKTEPNQVPEPTPTEQRPQTIRKSLSLTIIAIGALMLLVSITAAIAKKDTDPLRVILSAASLIATGSLLYLRRASEEKKLKIDSQT